jgi:histidinol phosphatase-like PHP family hydrolase/calcineurin-like phosphoesterase family protein
MSTPFTLLAISDLHYTGLARQTLQPAMTRGELARILLKKVFLRLEHLNVKPDLVVLLGDLIADGKDREATHDLLALYSELTRTGLPFLVIPGNHDRGCDRFNEIFDVSPGLHTFGDYGFIVYDDTFEESHTTLRSESALKLTETIAKENPKLNLIALQHAPIYPPIKSHYPYRPTNATEIMESFQKNGVVLSLSGHYHKGQSLRINEGVYYHTVPSLVEEPYTLSLITLEGRKVEVQEQSLKLAFPSIVDLHCHTEHAYCATTIDTATALSLAKTLGVTMQCVSEHAFQLYFEKKYAMSGKWQKDTQEVQRVWETPSRNRMVNYRHFAEKLRSPYTKIGLEVDLYDNGKLLLAPEDAEEDLWDFLIGSIHFIHDFIPGKTTQAEAEKLFLRDVEQLLHLPIKVLAHPFRFFTWSHLETPKHLYPVVAEMLADSGVAAEINFHAYQSDADFIRTCIEKNVKIALASDAHAIQEVGEFIPHINLLKQAGVTPKMFPDVLFSFT